MSSNMLNELMRQAQQMQEKMKQAQEEAGKKVIDASSGGGMVAVKINGRQEILSIQIEPEIVDADDIEMLQDLIAAAVNEGIRKSKEMMQEDLKKLTGGLSIPGLF
ncbi:MAG: YbaB/EbfC family nucleoid-associated protein [bacterium]